MITKEFIDNMIVDEYYKIEHCLYHAVKLQKDSDGYTYCFFGSSFIYPIGKLNTVKIWKTEKGCKKALLKVLCDYKEINIGN